MTATRNEVLLLCKAVRDYEGMAMPISQAQIVAGCKVCEGNCPALTLSWPKEGGE